MDRSTLGFLICCSGMLFPALIGLRLGWWLKSRPMRLNGLDRIEYLRSIIRTWIEEKTKGE